MDRPLVLALPVAALAAVVVPLRSIVVFEAVRELFDPFTLALFTRMLWSLVAVVGFPAVGYAYGELTGDGPAVPVLGVAGGAGFLGSLAGTLVLRFGAGASGAGSLPVELAAVGVFATLDAATFGLLVLGGYALSVLGD
ncbi:hypothetical protein [Natronomonas marina]|jgi:hypothetical protein|uniref:hypothetical protein n=1 Tax=Natronomonas marina TaxID=2961939 RepID=UPI0020CA1363|nr:hypothetical protein [Natronomonas marina]